MAGFSSQLLVAEHELAQARDLVAKKEASVQHLQGALAAFDALLKEPAPAKTPTK